MSSLNHKHLYGKTMAERYEIDKKFAEDYHHEALMLCYRALISGAMLALVFMII